MSNPPKKKREFLPTGNLSNKNQKYWRQVKLTQKLEEILEVRKMELEEARAKISKLEARIAELETEIGRKR